MIHDEPIDHGDGYIPCPEDPSVNASALICTPLSLSFSLSLFLSLYLCACGVVEGRLYSICNWEIKFNDLAWWN